MNAHAKITIAALAIGATLTLAGCVGSEVQILPSSYTSDAIKTGKARAERACGGPVWVWNVDSATSVQPFKVYWTILFRCKSNSAFIGPYEIIEEL